MAEPDLFHPAGALLQDEPPQVFSTIVADPPWQYSATKTELRSGGKGASAEHHYPTMTNAEIASLPVAALAADQAHLYLWVTNPRLIGERSRGRAVTPFDIAESWGFRPVTILTWVKTGRIGQGFYFRGATEHVIFATRGNLGVPPQSRLPNVFSAPRGRHSEKPGVFFDIVERVSPAPYLEMFSRKPRLGWCCWGNEVPTVDLSPLAKAEVSAHG